MNEGEKKRQQKQNFNYEKISQIKRWHCEQLYTNKFENLDEMDWVLQKRNGKTDSKSRKSELFYYNSL